MTPDEPASPGPPDAHEDHARSRADLQAELRSARKEERKRKHRWRRRTLYVLSFVVVLAGLGIGGIYVYANYRFDQIKKVHAKHLVAAPTAPGKPFNILLVGSDSRAFVNGDNQQQVNAFGNPAVQGGQRSDVTMVARIDPANKTVTVLSIPRDLWVNIPGDVGGISGMNRINAAFNSGPDLLIQTIEKDLGIPINHYIEVDFPGFSGMVNALGGVTMDFPTEVKDAYSGLDVTTTGCQVVNGPTALALVRSRHLYYMDSDGNWEYDGESDFSRIQRQDAFFRAVLAKINQVGLDPITINNFLGAAVSNLTIDDTLTEGDLAHLADDFRGLTSSHLITETLPTVGFVTDGGADVLNEAQPYAQNVINAFNQIGTSTTTPTPTTTAGQGWQVDHDDDRADRGPQPGRRRRAQRVDGQRYRACHRRRPHVPGLPGGRNRRRHHAARHGRFLGGPLRSIGHGGGTHAGVGAERARHLGARPGPQRFDDPALDRRIAVDRDGLVRCDDTDDSAWADHNDDHDDPFGRLRQHAAGAVESLALHPGSADPGDADHEGRQEEVARVCPVRPTCGAGARCAGVPVRSCRPRCPHARGGPGRAQGTLGGPGRRRIQPWPRPRRPRPR